MFGNSYMIPPQGVNRRGGTFFALTPHYVYILTLVNGVKSIVSEQFFCYNLPVLLLPSELMLVPHKCSLFSMIKSTKPTLFLYQSSLN